MEGMRMEYYFDTDDKLNRRKYAEFLKSMLENCDKYRREDSDGAYVIAIDSPWGTGKTRFAKMLRNYLEGREPKIVSEKVDQSFIPPAKEDRKFNVIYYNSWETDYWTDAIEPLMDSILNSEAFKQFRQDKRNKEAWKSLLRFAKGVLKASGYALASKVFGETAVGIFKTGLSELKRKPINPLARFKNKETHYMGFRKALEQVIAKTGKPLVIIVDELDRCRPTYAIQTLELVKHLFAVKGSFFIFALDVEQLSCMVRTLYGSNDASGYLCRFFDYIGRIPTPKLKEFVETKLMQIEYYKVNQSHFLEHNAEFIKRLAITFGFSLRDIDTIIKSYFIMCKSFLENYDYYSKHQVYLFLLALKYKDINAFNKVFKKTPNAPFEQTGISDKYVLNSQSDLAAFLMSLNNGNVLRNAFFKLSYYRGSKVEQQNARIISVDPGTLVGSGILTIKYLVEPGNETFQIISDVCNEFSWGNVLFYEDIAKWEEIKDFTVSEYMYSQLEMFNFALPADEPATQS